MCAVFMGVRPLQADPAGLWWGVVVVSCQYVSALQGPVQSVGHSSLKVSRDRWMQKGEQTHHRTVLYMHMISFWTGCCPSALLFAVSNTGFVERFKTTP